MSFLDVLKKIATTLTSF